MALTINTILHLAVLKWAAIILGGLVGLYLLFMVGVLAWMGLGMLQLIGGFLGLFPAGTFDSNNKEPKQ